MEWLRNFFNRPGIWQDDQPNVEPTKYRVHVVTGDRRGAGTDANVYVKLYDTQGRTSSSITSNTVFRNDNERNSTTTVDLKTSECGVEGPIVKVDVWRDNFADLSIVGSITNFFFGHRTKRLSSAWFLDRIEVEEVLPSIDEEEEEKTASTQQGEEVEVQQHHETQNGTLTNGTESHRAQTEATKETQKEEEVAVPETVHRGDGGGRKWVFPLQRWVAAHRTYTIHLHDCFLPQLDPNYVARRNDLQGKREIYMYEQKVEGGPAQVYI